jgi:hypothetical protein
MLLIRQPRFPLGLVTQVEACELGPEAAALALPSLVCKRNKHTPMPRMRYIPARPDARAGHERKPSRSGEFLKRKAVQLREHLAPEPGLVAPQPCILPPPFAIAPMPLGDRHDRMRSGAPPRTSASRKV